MNQRAPYCIQKVNYARYCFIDIPFNSKSKMGDGILWRTLNCACCLLQFLNSSQIAKPGSQTFQYLFRFLSFQQQSTTLAIIIFQNMTGTPNSESEYKSMLLREERVFDLADTPKMEQHYQMRQLSLSNCLREDLQMASYQNRPDQYSVTKVELEPELEFEAEPEPEQKKVGEKVMRRQDGQNSKETKSKDQRCGLLKISEKCSVIFKEKKASDPGSAAKLIHGQEKRVYEHNIATERKKPPKLSNITRRAYDFCKVAVATGYLAKKNKLIYYDDRRQQQHLQKRAQLAHKITEASSRVAKLQAQVEEAKATKAFGNALVLRNKEIPQSALGQAVTMPFGIVAIHNSSKCSFHRQANSLSIKMEGDYECFSDMESFALIGELTKLSRQTYAWEKEEDLA